MIAWGKELETQHRQLEAKNPNTSTLAKRPAKSRGNNAEDEGHAAKKTKVEGGSIANDVKTSYEKGTLAKVLPLDTFTQFPPTDAYAAA